jgi:hypothetical protein
MHRRHESLPKASSFVLRTVCLRGTVSQKVLVGRNNGVSDYRGTSLVRNSSPLGPYTRPMPRALWWSQGGGHVFMSEVPLSFRVLGGALVLISELPL